MSIRYGKGIRNTGFTERDPDFTDAEWHQSAIGDTGTSHTVPGRVYLVQCEWCPEAFAARTKVEAMEMFREHERVMLEANHPPTCDHDWQNRIGEYGPTGLGAQCSKCGQSLDHDFDPGTNRGHPVGMTCRRCGATEWQYVEGVLCLIPEQTPLWKRNHPTRAEDHGPDWSDWGLDHPDEGPSCRCGFNGTPEECAAHRPTDGES